MRMSEVPVSVVRREMSSSTWAWMVTSRAVVGSSAIISLGSRASAIAIITRWRMPPENWCGKLLIRFSGCGIPTMLSSSIARERASALGSFRWATIVSTICSSMVNTGFRLVIGSWKIIAMSRPRMSRISDSPSLIRSSPSNRTLPPSILPAGLGSSRMIARLVTLLPQPDSPTRPRRSPRSSSNEMPLTAWISPSCVRNRTSRSFTSSRSCGANRFGIGGGCVIASTSGPGTRAGRRRGG